MAELIRSGLLGQVPHAFSGANGLEVSDVLPGARLVRAKQVHSPDALVVDAAWDSPPEGDALVTNKPGLLLAIVTADCAPVLLHDPEAGVIGNAHAGWRGAVGGVLENAVGAMVSLGAAPERIRAAIGPTIAQGSYEVDAGFRDQFDASDTRFFADGREGHWQFDLPGYVAHRLQQAGLISIDDLAEDTYSQPVRFHSFRRASHAGSDSTGRQLSVIGLEP